MSTLFSEPDSSRRSKDFASALAMLAGITDFDMVLQFKACASLGDSE
jgi:hypothetical protein